MRDFRLKSGRLRSALSEVFNGMFSDSCSILNLSETLEPYSSRVLESIVTVFPASTYIFLIGFSCVLITLVFRVFIS